MPATRRFLAQSDFYIVTVPTPIDAAHRPDLAALFARFRHGRPLPQARRHRRLRIRPSIRARSKRIACRVSSARRGCTAATISPSAIRRSASIPATRTIASRPSPRSCRARTTRRCSIVADVYGSVVTAGIHRAPSIKVAEAAKVIENTQRDLNIAFMNELSALFERLGIDTGDVLAAAGDQVEFPEILSRSRRRPLHRRRSLLSDLPRRKGRLRSAGDLGRPPHQ